jgi:disulfide bond formation protein DsbB
MPMNQHQRSAVMRPTFLLVASLAMILGAYGFQYIGGMEPCEMCYWQRYAYYVAIPVLAIAILLAADSSQSSIARFLTGIAGLAFLTGAGVAGYHAGVEYGWWSGPESCTASGFVADTAEAFLEAIKGRSIVRCDEVPWSLFGISMAGYNFFASLGLAGLSLLFAFDKKGGK